MGKRNSPFGNQKSEVKFNADKRREYLSGFKKRKDERRAKAKRKAGNAALKRHQKSLITLGSTR